MENSHFESARCANQGLYGIESNTIKFKNIVVNYLYFPGFSQAEPNKTWFLSEKSQITNSTF